MSSDDLLAPFANAAAHGGLLHSDIVAEEGGDDHGALGKGKDCSLFRPRGWDRGTSSQSDSSKLEYHQKQLVVPFQVQEVFS